MECLTHRSTKPCGQLPLHTPHVGGSESRWPVSIQIKASKSSDQREITHLSFSTPSEKQIEALRTQAGMFQDPKKANKLNNSATNGSKKMEQVCPKKVRDSHRLSSKINRRYLSPKGS